MRCQPIGACRAVSLGLVAVALCAPAQAWSQTVVPILQNGPDSAKKIVAVIGDGYAQADMSQFAADAQSFIVDGVFAQDAVFHRNHTAFNVYRIDFASTDSGVSRRVYDEHGTPNDSNDDTIVSTTMKNTALGYIYSGSWAHCWMEGSWDTQLRIAMLVGNNLPNADYVIVILNETGWGGCGGGGQLVFTRGMPWGVVPHEMGHGLAGLHDEYTTDRPYVGAFNSKNCSTFLNQSLVAWGNLLAPGIALPTTFNSATMNEVTTVGMFEGCLGYSTGIYRPVQSCRMNSGDEFCPVCAGIIDNLLSGYVDRPADFDSLVSWPGANCRATGGASITYGSDATARNMSATPVQVSCPLGRVFPNGLPSNRASADAWVVDTNPTEDICCHVESKNPGGASYVGGEVCSSGSSTTYQVLKLDFPKLHDPYSFSHFHVDCALPGLSGVVGSRITTYRVGQQRF